MAGLLRRLFGGIPSRPATLTAVLCTGDETLEVIGESHYQDELWRIVGGRRADHVRHETYAVLVPNPKNEHDPNAIEVRVDGTLVGHLSADDAEVYLPGLHRLMERHDGRRVALHASIVGGGARQDARIGFLGIFLDHDPTDFGLPGHQVSNGHIRTGLYDALATDLEDDSYDLSWLTTLSHDDEIAARQLRSLLEDERDLIDRHYMFCELESRLYRCRDTRPSALDEFDQVCAHHHDEMATLRPALLDKFGVVPVIEMYRQAAIRCQKAKRWGEAREWATRGLDVYGNEAARPEVVDDLHKRVAHATAKIEAASHPRERKPRTVTVPAAPRQPEIETLTCASCGTNFERERTRGRKPKLCPTCRGLTRPVASA